MANMFLATTSSPFLEKISFTTSSKTATSNFNKAADAPMATMFFIRDVPNSEAISVKGIAITGAKESSGCSGPNLASAKMMPLAVSSL